MKPRKRYWWYFRPSAGRDQRWFSQNQSVFLFFGPTNVHHWSLQSMRRPHGTLKRWNVCSPRLAVIARQDSEAGLSVRACRRLQQPQDLEYECPLAPDPWASVKRAEAGDACAFTHVTRWQMCFLLHFNSFIKVCICVCIFFEVNKEKKKSSEIWSCINLCSVVLLLHCILWLSLFHPSTHCLSFAQVLPHAHNYDYLELSIIVMSVRVFGKKSD